MSVIKRFSEAELADYRKRFASASPYPHIVIDDFLNPAARESLSVFPDADWPYWSHFGDAYQRGKRVCADITVMPRPFAELIAECGQPAFLRLLERITGEKKLLPDPYLDGGGLHCSGPGGVLAPHTDFHLYERLSLFRRLNLLIYLNPDWSEADGGDLELSRKGEARPEVSVPPIFGRAVIFRTDDASVHGFTRPVAEGKQRRSVALYYYTSRESAGFSGDTQTYWQTHALMTGPRLALFNGLIFLSRAASKVAHIINPNKRAD
jgi:Rps23 Pro-64 3,4-dihydroxylase Tpa1-like proline 4-hydroxylase